MDQTFTNMQTIQASKKSYYIKKKEPLLDDSKVNHQPPKDLCTSARIQYQLEHGLLPERLVQTIDIDRLKEGEEDFLHTDRSRKLALDKKKLKPLILQKIPQAVDSEHQQFGYNTFVVQNRTILGGDGLFNEGHRLHEQKQINMAEALSNVKRNSSLALRTVSKKESMIMRSNSRQSGYPSRSRQSLSMERRVPITVTKKPKNASVNKNVA